MEESEVNQLLAGQTSYAGERGGHKIYYVLPQEEREDAERGFRVFCIGCPADRPTGTRCVLLLGETGAGKTTLVNAILNYLFGVKFSDPFRLQVKEEPEDDRMETESQTDMITAYTIYYREGMQQEYNFVLIDTPGLADTRGAQQQEDTRCRLEAFLTSDFGVDDLHCVGLVAKANTNRDFDSQKAVLGEITSLLGNNVPEITCIFATFAVEKPTVDAVVRNAGVPFKSMFHFDNGIIFTPQEGTCSQRHHTILSLRWDDMREQYDTFFSALISAPSVSIKLLREKKLFDTCKNNLKEQIEKLATSIAALEVDKKIYVKYELQVARNEGFLEEERVETINTVNLKDGMHAHNCRVCQQTCIFPCNNNSANLVVAGLTGALTGAVTAARVSRGSGIAPLVIGGVIGIAAGILNVANPCGIEGVKRACRKDRCRHPLPEHVREKRIIVKKSEIKKNVNKVKKELYDVAVSKKLDANAKIINGQQKILSRRRSISHSTVELLYHAKKIQELTSQDYDYIEEVTRQIISEIRLGEPSIIPHAIKHVNVVKEAMGRLTPCAPEEVLGRHELVEEMLLSAYREH